MNSCLRRWFLLILAVCTLPAGMAAAGEQTVQVYNVRHQLADDLLQPLSAVLQADESIRAYHQQLIVNASPPGQQAVAQLLAELDKPLRNLMITVRNLRSGNSTDNNTAVSGGIRTGEVYLGTGGPVYHDGPDRQGGITVRHDGVRIHSQHETRQTANRQEQTLRVIEGQPAWISTGEDMPYRSVDERGYPVTSYHSADRGFYVNARLTGDRVQLDITTSNDRPATASHQRRQGIINTERLETTISGGIGEWISLGGLQQQDSSHADGISDRRSRAGSTTGDILVKVVPLD